MNQRKSAKSKTKSVLIFIVISVFLWFLTKLSKPYQDHIQLEVSYTNLPSGKMLRNELPKWVDVNIEATGFKLLYTKLFQPKIEINLRGMVLNNEDSFVLDFNDQKNKIEDQLSKFMKIKFFDSPQVQVYFDNLETKLVKVEPRVSISYKDNYDAYGLPQLNPDSVLVSGPKSILDTLKRVETEVLVITDLNNNLERNLALTGRNEYKDLSFQTDQVNYLLRVREFTEEMVSVPFTIKNKPVNEDFNTFPNTVEISFRVALEDYEKINKNLFVVECDFELSNENNLNFLVPKVISSPAYLKDVQLKTEKIDFFITKQ